MGESNPYGSAVVLTFFFCVLQMGDEALHATSDVFYENDVRLAATIYVADILPVRHPEAKSFFIFLYRVSFGMPSNQDPPFCSHSHITQDNVDAIMRSYTQSYPPEDRPDILLGMAASHWNASDPAVKLPSNRTIIGWVTKFRQRVRNSFDAPTLFLLLLLLWLCIAVLVDLICWYYQSKQ